MDKDTISVQPSKAKSVESLPVNSSSANTHTSPTSSAQTTSARATRAQSASSDNIAVKMAAANAATSHRKQQSLGSLKIDRNSKSEEGEVR